MTSPYTLPEDQHQAIFRGIASAALARSTESRRPTLVLTVGQPGAGTPGLAAMAKGQFRGDGGQVMVDAEKLRAYHPEYAILVARNDQDGANLIYDDANRWATRLLHVATASRRNIVMNLHSHDPSLIEALCTRMESVGYQVEMHALAVQPAASELGLWSRFEKLRATVGHAWFTPKSAHDAVSAALPALIERVESAVAVSRLRVFDKDHFPIFENVRDSERRWRDPGDGLAVFNGERDRPPTLQERSDIAHAYDRLYASVTAPGRNAAPAEVRAIGSLKDRAHRNLNADLFRQVDDPSISEKYPSLAPAYTALSKARDYADRKFSSREADRFVAQSRATLAAHIERGALSPAILRRHDQSTDLER